MQPICDFGLTTLLLILTCFAFGMVFGMWLIDDAETYPYEDDL